MGATSPHGQPAYNGYDRAKKKPYRGWANRPKLSNKYY